MDDDGGDAPFLAIEITEIIFDLGKHDRITEDKMRKKLNNWDDNMKASGEDFFGLGVKKCTEIGLLNFAEKIDEIIDWVNVSGNHEDDGYKSAETKD